MKLFVVASFLFLLPGLAYQQQPVSVANLEERVQRQVDSILSLMTTEEKADFVAGLDTWRLKGIERLGIPPIQATDCGHGVTIVMDKEGRNTGSATCFPTAVMQAATWNTDLVQELGRALGRETLATGSRILLGPMINIKRLPINGRNFETFSEDPVLTGELAAAFVKGVQSEGVGAVIKQLAANNQQENQYSLNVVINERALREIYLPNFLIPIKKAEPWGVMTAYNGLNGSHTSENRHLLQGILKEEWGFKGFVVSDWRAVKSKDAIVSGLDLEMPGPGKYLIKENVMQALSSGVLTMAQLDDMVARLLRTYIKTGALDKRELDYPYELNSRSHQELARRVAEDGMILLKNDEKLLPLDTSIKRLAIIGPNASEARLGGGGSASVTPFYSVSPLDGITNFLSSSSTEVVYAEGCGLNGDLSVVDGKYAFSEEGNKLIPGFKVAYYNNNNLEGQPALVTVDPQIDFSWGWSSPKNGIINGGFSVKWTGKLMPPETGDYKLGISAAGGFRLYIDGALLLDGWDRKNQENFEAGLSYASKAISVALVKGKPVDVQVDFYKRTHKNFVRFEWEIPGGGSMQEAKEVAAKSDAVVVFAGLSNFFEGGNNDRSDISLPGRQDELITEIAKINKNTIVVLINGSPLAMPWVDDVKAIVEAYYPGQEGGNAIANVLFGAVNPSGKLPETFPKRLADCIGMRDYPGKDDVVDYGEGIFVGYRYYDTEDVTPLFAFGHGLSYTTFEYANLVLERLQDQIIATFEIKNSGMSDGAEVAQLYISDIKAKEIRPFKELKGFEKVFLRAGEKKKVKLTLSTDDLSYYSETENGWICEPGEFEVLIGSSSRDIRLKEKFDY